MVRRILVSALLATTLYVPLAAGAAPSKDGPPVSDGEMGCIVATGFMAMISGDIEDDTSKDTSTREDAAKMRIKSFDDNSFYLGRLSLLPPENRTTELYLAAYARFDKLDTDGKVKQIQACSEWAKDIKLGMIKPWTGK